MALVAAIMGEPPSEFERNIASRRLKTSGWSDSIGDYILGEKIKSKLSNLSEGWSKLVFRARLSDQARALALAAGGGTLSQGEFELHITRSSQTSYESALAHVGSELDLFNRIGRHEFMSSIVHTFTAQHTLTSLDDINEDGAIALCFVKAPHKYCLQDVIRHRLGLAIADAAVPSVSATVSQPLMRPEEMLLIMHDISCALVALDEECVAHRHVCVDSIYFDTSLCAAAAADDIVLENFGASQRVRAVLGDYRHVFDFKADDCKGMEREFWSHEKRFGCNKSMPIDIKNKQLVRTFINYKSADVWSLGVVLGTMMFGGNTLFFDLKTGDLLVTDKSLVASKDNHPMLNKMIELLKGMFVVEPSERWSIQAVHKFCSDVKHEAKSLLTT